ncbi:hypothetical protein [Streptomyces roseolilacinus]|nr:hypothetical protein [Streptomyces roseolilacinus]
MVRAGRSSGKAALTRQHSDLARQQKAADELDQLVRAAHREGADPSSGADLARDAWRGPDNRQGPGR